MKINRNNPLVTWWEVMHIPLQSLSVVAFALAEFFNTSPRETIYGRPVKEL